MINNTDFIITPDKLLSLATNFISRYGKRITYNPEENIIFLHSDNITTFIREVLPNIKYKFVLITHDADAPIINDYRIILDNKFIIKWFAMNCHILHEKLQPIPIGMANECWPHGNKETMLKIINENNKKDNFVYCNFDPNTNLYDRSYAITKLKANKFIDFEFTKLPYEEYLRKLSTYKYVISPPGNSIDCHRIWESIYVKTIPIVIKSIPMVFFKDCPILFINDWDDLSQEMLNSNYNAVLERNNKKADFNFYKSLILDSSKQLN